MTVRTRVSTLAALGVSLLLSACATRTPIILEGPLLSNEDDAAVVWTHTSHRKKRFERINDALILSINGANVARFARLPKPVLLPPGEHRVEIRYDRDSYLCGYLGCVRFEQARRQLSLHAEPGHSYLPLASKACDKDWIWIADTGPNAREALETWRRHGIYPQDPYDTRSPIKDVYTLKVVAGEAPPERCAAPGE